jgi:hypothetical protein
MKNAFNELSFLLITDTACSDTRFGRYRLLNSGYGADQILGRLDIQVINQLLGPQEAKNMPGFAHGF